MRAGSDPEVFARDGHYAYYAGYSYRAVGENIAWNQPTPKEVVAGWMQSQGHKENLLSDQFTQIGLAVAKSDTGKCARRAERGGGVMVG